MKYLLLLAFLCGCANPYQQFYKSNYTESDIKNAPGVEIAPKYPEILSRKITKSFIDMMAEDGYLLIGYSSFSAGNASNGQAAMHGKKIGAHLVVIDEEYSNTESGVMPWTTPTTDTSFTNFSGNTYGGGMSSFSGTATTTTYGSRTTYIPYSVDRYNYFAVFFAKLRPPIFGARLKSLSKQNATELGTYKGAEIEIVENHSPAYNADLMPGDVIMEANEKPIIDFDSFDKLIYSNIGKEIKLKIIRNKKEIEKTVVLAKERRL